MCCQTSTNSAWDNSVTSECNTSDNSNCMSYPLRAIPHLDRRWLRCVDRLEPPSEHGPGHCRPGGWVSTLRTVAGAVAYAANPAPPESPPSSLLSWSEAGRRAGGRVVEILSALFRYNGRWPVSYVLSNQAPPFIIVVTGPVTYTGVSSQAHVCYTVFWSNSKRFKWMISIGGALQRRNSLVAGLNSLHRLQYTPSLSPNFCTQIPPIEALADTGLFDAVESKSMHVMPIISNIRTSTVQ